VVKGPAPDEVSRNTRPVKIPAKARGRQPTGHRVGAATRVARTDTNIEHRQATDMDLERRHEIAVPTAPVTCYPNRAARSALLEGGARSGLPVRMASFS